MSVGRTLVLHVGLPKTASSALQVWADRNRDFLLERGVHYPPGNGALMPKHQDLVAALFTGDLAPIDAYILAARAPVLFLSTEGLTNHLYDFPGPSLAALRERLSGWIVRVFIVTRARESWITSYWKQAVLNPRIERYNYATPLSRDAFAVVPRVARLADFDRVAQDAQAAYGAAEVLVADQGSDWFEALRGLLGLQETGSLPEKVHVSVSDDLTEIVRQVNGMELDDGLRSDILALAQHSHPTGHNILIQHGRSKPLEALARNAEAIARCISKVKAETVGQAGLLSSMRATLESGGLEDVK